MVQRYPTFIAACLTLMVSILRGYTGETIFPFTGGVQKELRNFFVPSISDLLLDFAFGTLIHT